MQMILKQQNLHYAYRIIFNPALVYYVDISYPFYFWFIERILHIYIIIIPLLWWFIQCVKRKWLINKEYYMNLVVEVDALKIKSSWMYGNKHLRLNKIYRLRSFAMKNLSIGNSLLSYWYWELLEIMYHE